MLPNSLHVPKNLKTIVVDDVSECFIKKEGCFDAVEI